MSYGSLPPVPGLIPISALRKSPSCNNNSNNDIRECTPCATIKKEVMGEQRSRRIISQPTVELIDIVKRSRVCTTTPQAPPSGKARAERHRKSDRRRGEHRGDKKRSTTKREKSQSEEESCVNPRVNPIFVWVRQENTHIVDVKCEDYDKRNRIVLTKTAQGWRAIPRTETLVPNLKAAANDEHQSRKIKKNHRVKRKSAAVQVDEEVQQEAEVTDPPTWSVPINIESHLPSHTIPIHRKRSLSPEEDNCSTITDDVDENVNTSVDQNYDAQASSIECSANKICDVSPLDNLLAVAELEFNQQIQTEAWCESTELKMCDSKDFDVSMDSKNEECSNLFSQSNSIPIITPSETFDSEEENDDCDYNEDDENNIAMNDILTRLEQSLQSPDALCAELNDNVAINNNLQEDEQEEEQEEEDEEDDEITEDQKQTDDVLPESISDFLSDDNVNLETIVTEETKLEVIEIKEEPPSSTTLTELQDDTPTDLSTSKTVTNDLTTSLTISVSDDDLVPTDLSLPKKQMSLVSPRPSSRCSETIQSPQPSGLPAVPHSPDVQSKSAYLESLLSTTSQKMGLGSDVSVTKQKEPLDFGKCRKSASPTVTCSEEINSSINCFKRFEEGEPEAKKMKLDDIHLRTMLDANTALSRDNSKNHPKTKSQETSRLLELLTSSESELDAVAQLKQLQSDFTLNLPDPMLVPKDRLSQILMSPGKEIPRLLAQRPELRLPEALAFPHLLQDPDILVITISQLETIIKKQSVPVPSEKVKPPNNVKKDSDSKEKLKVREQTKPNQAASKEGLNRMNELCNDVNLTNSNALNQMMWLPYLHQLEVAAMAFGNGADFLKMLSTAFPPYTNQVPDISQMFPLNRYPQQGFPIQSNPFEFPMWPETTSHLRSGNQFDRSKNACRDYMEKIPFANGSKTQSTSSHKYLSNKSHHVASSMYQPNNSAMHNLQHSFMNVPPAAYQTHNIRPNLQIPQFNSLLSQKSSSFNKNNDKVTSQSTNNCDFKSNYYRTPTNANQKYSYNQKLGSLANNHKSKVTNMDSNLNKNVPTSSSHDNYNTKKASAELGTQPMDLSGSNPCKVRSGKNFYGSDNFNKSPLKLDDVPEVGSTTVNIEDMTSHLQDSQKHLWHPLFGNQKSSTNPWNWTTVSATGE